jgi:hypothetical protein
VSGWSRPEPGEYDPFYEAYIALVPDGDILATLRDQLAVTIGLLAGLTEEQERHRYAPGKWSLREVVGHLIDAERVFAYRALAMARAPGADLPGMEQDEWVAESGADQRGLTDMIDEWIAIRRSNVHMFAGFPPGVPMRAGRANGLDFTARCFPWLIAGHELWHRRGIRRDYLGEPL